MGPWVDQKEMVVRSLKNPNNQNHSDLRFLQSNTFAAPQLQQSLCLNFHCILMMIMMIFTLAPANAVSPAATPPQASTSSNSSTTPQTNASMTPQVIPPRGGQATPGGSWGGGVGGGAAAAGATTTTVGGGGGAGAPPPSNTQGGASSVAQQNPAIMAAMQSGTPHGGSPSQFQSKS